MSSVIVDYSYIHLNDWTNTAVIMMLVFGQWTHGKVSFSYLFVNVLNLLLEYTCYFLILLHYFFYIRYKHHS